MIIWINGAFGVGKTHTAYELHRRLVDSFVFDPELVGFYLSRYLPTPNTFEGIQDLPLWRQQVKAIIAYCDKNTGITIVPMTIIDDQIFDCLINEFLRDGIKVKHYTLMADKATIEKRLMHRGDKHAWSFKQVDRCLDFLSRDMYAKHIDTTKNDLNAVVEWIANDVGLTLKKGRQNPLLSKLKWLKIHLNERIVLSLISFLKM
jgi:hypothetical protein